MSGKHHLALFGVILLLGVVLANQQTNQQDMTALHKNRRIAVVNELIKAQDQIQKALKKMYKAVAPAGGEHGYGEGDDCGSEESKESTSGEEQAYIQMKQQQVKDARKQINELTRQLAVNMLKMDKSIEKIDHKVDREIKDSKTEVNYTLFYNKPAKPHHHHRRSSEEHSDERGYRRRSVRPERSMSSRVSRQLTAPEESVPEENEQIVVAKDGEEVLKTLPEVNAADETH